MKKRAKILRLRPYNMANFSGGSYYMPLYALLEAFAFVPLLLFLCFFYGISVNADEEGKMDFPVLKRRLQRTLLPLCLVLSVIYVLILIQGFWETKDFLTYGVVTIWLALIFSVGLYFALYFSAQHLHNKGKLTLGRWFLRALIYGVLIIVGGIIISVPLGLS